MFHNRKYQNPVGNHYECIAAAVAAINLPVSCAQCAEEQRRVPESLYPFTYNPKMSLNLSQVPSSSQRSPPLTRTQLKDITEAKDQSVSPFMLPNAT